jgi:predicted type IV restriction endonuclease
MESEVVMATTMRAADVSWRDLRIRFGLQPAEAATFFMEWRTALPEISEQEKQQLDRIRTGYLNLMYQTSMLEDAVKMAIVSPLLFLADFFLPPFAIQSEVAVQLSITDEEMVIEGKIDILVLQEQLWIMYIESKRAAVSLEVGLPQLLAYMLSIPTPAQPIYGLITNGGSFVFLKLVQGPNAAYYALSRIFEMRNPGNELYAVLAVLKNLKRLVLQEQNGAR